MFVAQDETGKLVELWRLTRSEVMGLKGKKYVCPVCQSEVLLRQGRRTRAHFAHYERQQCRTARQAESLAHLTGKGLLAKWLSEEGVLTVEVERYFQRIHRQADLVVNHQLVIEYQCSPIALGELIARTHDYQRIGLSVIWILGAPLFLKQQVKSIQVLASQFSSAYHRHVFQLDVQKQVLIVRHHLRTCSDRRYVTAQRRVVTERGQCLYNLFEEAVSTRTRFELTPMPVNVPLLMQQIKQERWRLQRSLSQQQPSVMLLQKQLYMQKTHLMGLPPAFFWMQLNWLDNHGSTLALLVGLKTVFWARSFIDRHKLVDQLDRLYHAYALDSNAHRAKVSFDCFIQAVLHMWETTGYIRAFPEGYRIEKKLHECVSASHFEKQLEQEINALSSYVMFPKDRKL